MLYTSRSQTVTDRRKFILLGFLNIIFLISITDSAPLSSDHPKLHLEHPEFSSASSQPSPPKLLPEKRTLDGGRNPSELAWQAWLLFDNGGVTDPRSSSDSANMFRRITPKSIFIAPPLPSCPEGYVSDGMNRCVKNLQIDQDAHINFLLERLNAMYANLGQPKPAPQPEPEPPSSSSSLLSLSLPQVPGPFQLNIPLVLETTKNDTENGDPNDKTISSDDEETIVTVYEVKDTKKEGSHEEKDEKIFLVENQSTKVDNNDKIAANEREKLVPIVEFVQETDSNITSIVDYNVPVISMSQIQNRTELIDDRNTKINDKNVNGDGISEKSQISNDSSSSSTVVLVLSPSELPLSNVTKRTSLTQNASTEQDVIRIENDDKKPTDTKPMTHSSSQDDKTFSTPIKIFFNDSESNNESTDIEVTTAVPNDESDTIENEETTLDYEDEDENEEEHDVTTEHTEDDFDVSTESEEEILKHSEAGLSVTMPTIRINFPFNSVIREKNVSAPNVSSVVIIHDDFIRETTLLGLNSNRPVNMSKDSKISDDKTSIESQQREKVVVVTPKSRITTETTPRKTVLINNLNDEENTEMSTITEKLMTESLEVETITPITTQIDEISLLNSDNINPVVTIEEALMDEAINHKRQPSVTETFKIIPSNSYNDDKSRIIKEGSDSSEMMTASSTNVAKVVFPRDEIRKESPSTPLVDGIHSMKFIRASSPPRFDIIKNNSTITPSVNNNKQVYGYDAIPQHHPNHHADIIDDNRPNIKIVDEHRLESNINRPVIETMYNQRFGSNKNQNHRKNFFPSNIDTPFVDSTRSHVIFPTHKRPHTRPGNVRFPTEEANSIHTSDDLKEKYNRPSSLSSNVGPIRAGMGGSKQSNWRLPSSWRSDRQQPSAQRFRSITNEQRQRVRSPMLMKFWTKMPLVKDPSLLYHPTYPTVVPVDTVKQHNYEPLHSSRIANFYHEMSAYDQTRTFAQQSETDG